MVSIAILAQGPSSHKLDRTRGSSEKMVSFKILACLALAAQGARRGKRGQTSASWGSEPCPDPLAAIRQTMDCLEVKNSSCVNQGYNWIRFNKYHNGKNVGLQLFPVDIYWQMALKFSTFKLIYDHAINVGTNKASVRYIEDIRMSNGTEFDIPPNSIYPFNEHIVQYEHALVSVDNDCKMTRWDQYGDDAEQKEVDDAMAKFMADECVKKALNIPFAKC